MAQSSPSLNYDQILTALRLKREQIEEAILAVERVARAEESSDRHAPREQATPTTSGSGTDTVTPKKRSMSEAGRQRIIAAAKKRWRLIRAAKKQSGNRKASGRKSAAKKSG